MLDVTGAGPDASIVGNALERGFGHSPYGDHFRHTCGMEVVLADGRLLRTGFGSYQNAQAARVYPWGIGPWIDGLFTQSNFGIVTKIGVWLMPRPPVCQAFAFTVSDPDKLGEIVTRLRHLRLHNIVTSSVHIANDLRVLSARMTYPWHLTDGATPLPDTVREALRERAALGAWNVLGGLYGTRETVAAARRAVRNVFQGFVRVRFFDGPKIQRLRLLGNVLGRFGLGNNLRETLASASNVYDLLRGIPSPDHLRGVGWRSRVRSDNPTDHGCLWISPILPMTAEACSEILAIVQPILARHRFDPLMTITTVNPRALCCVINITYDKANAEERLEAIDCYDELFHALFHRGYIPYRVGIQSMSKLAMGSNVYWDVCRQLKSTFDPAGVIAPGRYQPDEM
jgi:4-cresol dehydrogenase (hydroxylating)